MPVSHELAEEAAADLTELLNDLPDDTSGICLLSFGMDAGDENQCVTGISHSDGMPHGAWIYLARLVLEHGRSTLASCAGDHAEELRRFERALATLAGRRLARSAVVH